MKERRKEIKAKIVKQDRNKRRRAAV